MLTSEQFSAAQVQSIIEDIAMGVSSSSGEAYFEKLVLHLWRLYKMSHILVGVYNKEQNSVTTLKFCINGKIVDNITYPLEDTPCADIICDKSAVYSKDVQVHFPQDIYFQQNNIQSYLGIRLLNSKQECVGLISCLDTKEIVSTEIMLAILEIFASRASAEIERMHNEQKLEERVQQRTQALEDAMQKIQKHSSETLLNSEKMSSLGAMVAGFTHDINTPIGLGITGATYIESETKVIIKKADEGRLSKKDLNEYLENTLKMSESMSKSLDKAKELVRSFKLISMDQHLNEDKEIGLKAYIDDIILSLHFKLKHTRIRIENTIPADLQLYTQASALFQIFGNLILNSIKHGFDETKEGKIEITANYDKEHVYITYEDNGKGMSEESMEHLYEQFYTTQKDNGGTGLGMYIVHETVLKNLGGEINLVSKPNRGVKFIIRLPRH